MEEITPCMPLSWRPGKSQPSVYQFSKFLFLQIIMKAILNFEGDFL
jgi:hypothetical protein